jgi:hypothetical protein
MGMGDIRGSVVGHHTLDPHAALTKPPICPPEERDRVLCRQRLEYLGIGKARVVVHHHVHVFVASHATLVASVKLTLAVPQHSVARTAHRDPPELLDVDVHELTRMAALVAVGRLGRVEARALAEPDPLQPA